MAYVDKLASPKWQRKRLEIFNRDNWKCQHCGTGTIQLEVHHIDYWEGKQPWEYPDDLLITVCHHCHKEEMVRVKHEKYLLESLKQAGFLAADILAFSTMLNTHIQFRDFVKNKIREYAKS